MSLPDDLQWFVSSEVEVCTVAGRSGQTVWINHRLIRASNFDHAYERAMEFGKAEETTYLNSDNERVTWRFRGLQALHPLLDGLEDGTELVFDSYDDQSEEQVSRRLHCKEELRESVAAEHDDREAQTLIDAEFKKIVEE